MRPLPHHMPCRCPLKVVRLRVHPPRVAIRGKRDVQVDHQRSYKWTSQPEILQRPYRALARRVFNLPLQDQRIPDAPARSNAVIVPCYRGAYFDLAALILCCSNGIAYTPRRVLGKAVSDTGFPLLYGTCESNYRFQNHVIEATSAVSLCLQNIPAREETKQILATIRLSFLSVRAKLRRAVEWARTGK
jgi:hypothetical protein